MMEKNETKQLFKCRFCVKASEFMESFDFEGHLRTEHCSKEGGSFVCRYGSRSICPSCPLEGMSESDYQCHLHRFHLLPAAEQEEQEPRQGRSSTAAATATTPFIPFTSMTGTQNLSSVLSDPNKSRHQNAIFFTRDHGDGFQPHTGGVAKSHLLIDISKADFRAYRRRIAKKYKKQVESRQRLAASRTQQPAQMNSDHWKGIPKVLLSNKFTLAEADCFAAIFPNLEQNNFEEAQRRELRSRLESWHDAVESQLAVQLESKSARFYDAVLAHVQVAHKLGQAQISAEKLRSKMAELKRSFVDASTLVLRCHQRRLDLESLAEQLRLMRTVQAAPQLGMNNERGISLFKIEVRSLLQQGDYPSALDVTQTAQEVVGASVNLQRLAAFRHLSEEMSGLQSSMRRILNQEFVKVVQSELNKPILGEFYGGADEEEEKMEIDEGQVVPVILGMLRVKELKFCAVLKEEITLAVKNLLRTTVRQGLIDGAVKCTFEFDPNVALADQTRKLAMGDWRRLLDFVLCQQMSLCRHVERLVRLLQQLVAHANGVPFAGPLGLVPSASSWNQQGFEVLDAGECRDLECQLAQLVPHACAASEERAAKLINARAKDQSIERLAVLDFVSLWTRCRSFLDDCDRLLGQKKAGGPLQICLQSQSVKLVSRFDQEKKTKLANILESELWKVAQVPQMFQKIADFCAKTGRLRDFHAEKSDKVEKAKPSPHLLVDGEKFALAGTALLLLQMMGQYCQMAEKMPFCAQELLNRLIDLLKSFNSRTCQLIIGAGAIQLVGLKTISIRHLALASRCLQLINRFIPICQSEFASLTVSEKQMKIFDQIIKDYEDHVDEIFSKILFLVEQNLEPCLQRWNLKSSSIPSASFQQIGKLLRLCYNGVEPILPQQQVQKFMLRVHDNFKKSLREHLERLEIGPQQQNSALYGLVCSEFSYYMEVLRSLPCCAALSDTLADVFKMDTF